MILIIRKKINFKYTKGHFNSIIKGESRAYLNKIEEKFLIPIILFFMAFGTVIFVVLNILVLDVYPSKVFIILEVGILVVLSLWGYFIFQMKPRGKILLLWFFSFLLLFIGGAVIDLLRNDLFLAGRILILLSPAIVIGFVSYLYKITRLKSINTVKTKVFLLFFVIFSFFAHFYDELADVDAIEYSLFQREVHSIQWISKFTSEKNVISTEFGIDYVFTFHEYSFESSQMLDSQFHYFIPIWADLFPPENHFNETTGKNILQEIKNEYDTNFFLIPDDDYLALREGVIIGRLNQTQLAAYYNLNYLNKVFSSKSVYGEEVPYYWII